MSVVNAADWDSYWESYADSAEENPAQKYRRKLITTQLRASGVVRMIVDAGAGQGDLLFDLARSFPDAQLFGLEPSESGRRFVERKVPTAQALEWDGMSQLAPEVVRGQASHLTCSEVLEHVAEPTVVLRNAASALAPGGTAVVTVPGGPKTAFDRYIGHRQHFRADGLKTVMEAAGLCDVKIYRAGFPIFNVYKTALLMRGKKLIADVDAGNASPSPGLAMRAFDRAFAASAANSPFGWQLVGVGRCG